MSHIWTGQTLTPVAVKVIQNKVVEVLKIERSVLWGWHWWHEKTSRNSDVMAIRIKHISKAEQKKLMKWLEMHGVFAMAYSAHYFVGYGNGDDGNGYAKRPCISIHHHKAKKLVRRLG